MISDQLFDQIFIDVERQKTYSEGLIRKCKQNLEQHGLWGEKVEVASPINVALPHLEGVDINHHFTNIARQQTHSYKNMLDKLVKAVLPPFPEQWAFQVCIMLMLSF